MIAVVPMFISPWQLLLIAGIVLLLFGNRLPSIMRSLGSSVTEFKKGIEEGDDEDAKKKDDRT